MGQRVFNRRSLFLLDGLIFFLVGLIVLIFPSARGAAVPTSAGSFPHLQDTRRLLGIFYMNLGLFAFVFSHRKTNGAARTRAARFRAFTLILVMAVNLYQILSGRWKPAPLRAFIMLFSCMTFGYLYFGFLKPEREEAEGYKKHEV